MPDAVAVEVGLVMRSFVRSTTGAVCLVVGLAYTFSSSLAYQDPATPPQPPAGAGAAAPQQPGRGGRGGGRGNQMAAVYTERCAACHGTETTPGRAPNLFDDQWVRAKDDEGIAAVISEGVPQTEMMPFKGQLTDPQIWQLVAYLKTAGANATPRPTFVPDPDGQQIKSEKQTFTIEVLARDVETPWGLAFLPDGRLLVTERGGRL